MGGQEQWPTTAEAVFTGMADWRVAHPRTTLREIEEAVLAVWFIRRCHAPAERAIPDLMISSGVIRHQRMPCIVAAGMKDKRAGRRTDTRPTCERMPCIVMHFITQRSDHGSASSRDVAQWRGEEQDHDTPRLGSC